MKSFSPNQFEAFIKNTFDSIPAYFLNASDCLQYHLLCYSIGYSVITFFDKIFSPEDRKEFLMIGVRKILNYFPSQDFNSILHQCVYYTSQLDPFLISQGFAVLSTKDKIIKIDSHSPIEIADIVMTLAYSKMLIAFRRNIINNLKKCAVTTTSTNSNSFPSPTRKNNDAPIRQINLRGPKADTQKDTAATLNNIISTSESSSKTSEDNKTSIKVARAFLIFAGILILLFALTKIDFFGGLGITIVFALVDIAFFLKIVNHFNKKETLSFSSLVWHIIMFGLVLIATCTVFIQTFGG